MIKLNKQYSINELAEYLGAVVVDNMQDTSTIVLDNVATLEKAATGSVSFLVNRKYHSYLVTSKASVLIVPAEYASHCTVPVLVTKNTRLALAKLMQLCLDKNEREYNIHATTVFGANCIIDPAVNIAPNCVIGDNVVIKQGVSLEAGVVIGANCCIGENSVLKANVTLYANVTIGNNTTVHSNSVLGSDGFGYANDADGNWVKMPHLGGVVIGNNVEIGSNVSIDRGFLENTEIQDGVIIDNLVQIGHNAIIGKNTAIAGCVAVAGSANIGAFCQIGGASSIAGHIKLADGVHVTATSGVNRSLLKPGVYSSGFPVRENSLWNRNVARFHYLDDLAKRVRKLEQAIKLEESQ